MLEIIALIFLTRKIGVLAIRKGQKPGKWKLNTVLAWFGFEIIGAFIGLAINGNIYMAMLLGITCAVGGYLLMKYQLDKLPDIGNNDWLERIGQSDAEV